MMRLSYKTLSNPVDPDFWNEYKATNPLYHHTPAANVDDILRNGLHPWDAGPGTRHQDGWLTPRPGHVYLYQVAIKPRPGDVPLEIDPKYLNPENVNPDEDLIDEASHLNPEKAGLFTEIPGYNSLGDFAEDKQWGSDPQDTETHLLKGDSIAYKGSIPPHAIKVATDYATPEREFYSRTSVHLPLLENGGKEYEWDNNQEKWVLHSINDWEEGPTQPTESLDEDRHKGIQIGNEEPGTATAIA